MKRSVLATVLCIGLAIALLAIGCEWNVPNEDEDDEIGTTDCPGLLDSPSYDCGDACCEWFLCADTGPANYADLEGCMFACDGALHSDRDQPIQNEGYKNCVLTCIQSCEIGRDCRISCEVMYPD